MKKELVALMLMFSMPTKLNNRDLMQKAEIIEDKPKKQTKCKL